MRPGKKPPCELTCEMHPLCGLPPWPLLLKPTPMARPKKVFRIHLPLPFRENGCPASPAGMLDMTTSLAWLMGPSLCAVTENAEHTNTADKWPARTLQCERRAAHPRRGPRVDAVLHSQHLAGSAPAAVSLAQRDGRDGRGPGLGRLGCQIRSRSLPTTFSRLPPKSNKWLA